MNTILTFLEKTENNKFLKFIYYLFLPISFLLETICFYYYWYLIKKELLTNEDMVNFFVENEFAYKWNKLYKLDIIEPDTFLNQFNLDELKFKIKNEITEILLEKISEITAIDIENFLNVIVFTEYVEGNIKQYKVEIKYFRYYVLRTLWIPLIIWVLLLSGIFSYFFIFQSI